jgi:hypothetical protein
LLCKFWCSRGSVYIDWISIWCSQYMCICVSMRVDDEKFSWSHFWPQGDGVSLLAVNQHALTKLSLDTLQLCEEGVEIECNKSY